MKVYDLIRGDISLAIASFMDEYQGDKKMSTYRQHDLETFTKLIQKYDDERDAFLLRREVKLYADNMGSYLFSWMTSLSVYQLKHIMLAAVKKPEYKKIKLLQGMHEEEKENTFRVEEQLNTKLERVKNTMMRREDLLKDKLSQADKEIARLQREINFLTDKLMECRNKLENVEANLTLLLSEKQVVRYEPQQHFTQPSGQEYSQFAQMFGQHGFWQEGSRKTMLPEPLEPAKRNDMPGRFDGYGYP